MDAPIPETWPQSLAEAAERLVTSISDEDRGLVLDTPPEKLVRFHHGWGTRIRNEFGLWAGNHSLLADCGSPEMEADDASAVIMKAVWNRLHGIPPEDARIKNWKSQFQGIRDTVDPTEFYLSSVQSMGEIDNTRRYVQYIFGLDDDRMHAVVERAMALKRAPNTDQPQNAQWVESRGGAVG